MKAAKEFRDLWAINFGAFERLLRGYGLGRVPAPWLALTLVLDDLLYLAALPLAVLGWTRTRRPEDRAILGLWIAWSCLTGAAFFAITRFRFPIMPFVLLLAARGLLALVEARPVAQRSILRRPRHWFLPAAVALAITALVYPSFAPGQYRIGATRAAAAAQLERGYDLLDWHRPAEALAAFERLPADFYATPTALAAAYHALGQDDRALALLDDGRDFPGATLLRGDILRAQGRERDAFASFNGRDVETFTASDPADLAWDRLNPPPLARLDVGNGLDLGYVRGTGLREREPDGTTYRWTGGRAEIRLAVPEAPDGGHLLRLRLKGYRPSGPIPPVRVGVTGRPVGEVTPTGAWQVYELPVDPAAASTVVVRLETATFVPGFADQRRLGAMLDWAEIVPAGAGR